MTVSQISAYVIVYEERFLLEKEFGKFAQSLFWKRITGRSTVCSSPGKREERCERKLTVM